MTIPCRILVADDPSSQGVRLWAIAQDGSERAWFIWFENEGAVGRGAKALGLATVDAVGAEHRYLLTTRYKLGNYADMDFEVLAKDWKEGTDPSFIPIEKD